VPAGWAAAAAGVLGAGASLIGSSDQQAAEQSALAQQEQMFQQEQSNEKPFIQGGQGAQTQLNYLLGTGPNSGSSSAGGYGSLNTPFTMDNFKQLSPQYNFDLQQGAQGSLNGSAAGQGALSGAALKDLTSYNQNYANNSFNSAFANYNTQQNNIFARLSNIATLGSSAGSNSTTGAGQFAGTIGNTIGSIGASQAAGAVGAANALGGGLSSAGNTYLGQQNLAQILGSSNSAYNPNSNSNGDNVDDGL
jgi:hypothetical protein